MANNKKKKIKVAENKELEFIIGAAMMLLGLWLLLKKVYVSSSFFGGYIHISGMRVRTGIFTIPLVAGLVWMFFKPNGKAPKIFSVAGFVLIIVVVICSVSVRVAAIPLSMWLVILFLIAAGIGIVIRSLKISNK